MTDGFGFLAYVFILPALILGGISCLCIVFFIRFQSFRSFVCSKAFWIAWLFPYCTLLLIVLLTYEWELLTMYICGISLPLVYYIRRVFIQSHLNLVSNRLKIFGTPKYAFDHLLFFLRCNH